MQGGRIAIVAGEKAPGKFGNPGVYGRRRLIVEINSAHNFPLA
jgi:hypothetical protein